MATVEDFKTKLGDYQEYLTKMHPMYYQENGEQIKVGDLYRLSVNGNSRQVLVREAKGSMREVPHGAIGKDVYSGECDKFNDPQEFATELKRVFQKLN